MIAICHPFKKHYAKGLCKTCYCKKYKKNNPEKQREYQRRHKNELHKYMLKSKFGLSVGEYAEMLKNQNGVCAICGKPENGTRRMSVDHNHKTGKVRGLLCQKCNSIIGMATENASILKTAIHYLERYKE